MPDGVAHDHLGSIDRFVAQSGEHGEHPGVGLGEAPVVRSVENELLRLAGLLALKLAGGVGPDELEHLPALLSDHRRHSIPPALRQPRSPSARAMSMAARPLLTQPLAVPSGTSNTSPISA